MILWEDYLQRVEARRTKKQRAAKDNARMDIMEAYRISDKTFYVIRTRLKSLCEDL